MWIEAASFLGGVLVATPATWVLVKKKTRGHYSAGMSSLERSLDDVAKRIVDADQQVQAAQKRTAGFQAACGVLTTERDNWKKLYEVSAAQAGNAQALMMRIIDRLAQALKHKGIDPKLPPVLQQVQQEFFAAHIESAQKELAVTEKEP
jgi:hypothetical protein